ncbi:hypothetical protein GGI25_005010 [Coemansia spiralis]|uniref:DUF3533 domain-containing protein n=2 Tax=Coemansia TaxID=4863 RepID=A0A9W8KWM8_9FUNG|nr:hypothetical protein BX070DRAFT_223915 [Coemansia spiralis]KAJ1989174.1 hypothetical protein EDC05_004830 [Coemansia umbellata]KAJ2620128.1 hypothetical protein GGI26_005243 [Coemansia sp. RSA 1358]KAJ2672692.1 hypothetical protein GGI25_005010 [Coemansia spiralis]
MGRISMFSNEFRPTLQQRALYYLRVLVISLFMIWVPLCLFYGAVYKRTTFAHDVVLKVVDFDNGLIGAQISQTLLMQNTQYQGIERENRPVWRQSIGEFGSADEINKWVRLHGWGALAINAGASVKLEQATQGTNSTPYDPKQLLTFFISSGHHPIMYQSIDAAATLDIGKAIGGFAVGMLQNRPAFGQLSVGQLAQLVTQPVAYQTVDVAPYTFGIAPVVYLFGFLLGTLMTVGAMIKWKMTTFVFFLKTKHHHIWLASMLLFLIWSICFGMYAALAMAAFEGPGYKQNALPFTVGRFFSIWGTAAMTIMANGLWLCNWYILLPPELLGLVSLMTALPNTVSTLVIAKLAPHFYRWFHVLPFYNGAMLYRYILSGAFPHIGWVAIVLGDICAMSLVLFVTTWVRQVTVLLGIADVAGWLRGNMFFHSSVPYYKEQKRKASASVFARSLSIMDSVNDDASLREGNLGV